MPRLLAMLCVLAVFVPSFFMTGVARSLFVPLSLAVGFSMIASYLLSSTFVPVLSVWLLRQAAAARRGDAHGADWVDRLRGSARRAAAAAGAGARLVVAGLRRRDGGDRRRRSACGSAARSSRRRTPRQFQLRFRAPAGTKFESTERLGRRRARRDHAGGRPGQRRHHAGLRRRAAVDLPDQHDLPVDRRVARGRAAGGAQAAARHARSATFEEDAARAASSERFPTAQFSFEPGDIVSRIMNFGAPTPVEVAVSGPDFAATRDVRGEGARRARADSVAARPAVRPGARLPDHPGERRTGSWPGSSASPSIRSASRSPRPPRRAASSRRTTGPTRAPASRTRCR